MAAIPLSSSPLLNDPYLQGYWPFEGNLNDSSVNGYNLTNNGSTDTASGKFGNGRSFVRASSQYATITDGSAPNLEITGSQTFGLWINFSSLATQQYLMGKADSGVTKYHLMYLDGAGTLAFILSGTGSVTTTTAPTTSTWYFLVGVFDTDANTMKIYLNNVCENTATNMTGTPDDTNAGFSIGRGGDFNGNYVNGIIDDVFVFSRALTDVEINHLYTGTPLGGYMSTKRGYW